LFRPLTIKTEELHKRLPAGMFSTCVLEDVTWIRSVAANPLANIDKIIETLNKELK